MTELNTKKVEITVANRTIVKVLFVLLVTALGVRFIINVTHILTLIFFSIFLALALNPAVAWIGKRLKIKSRAGATGIAYISVLTLIVAFFSLIIPPLVKQTSNFISTLPNTIQSLHDQNSTLGRLVNRYNLEDNLDDIAGDMRNRIKDLPQPVLSTASRIGATVLSTITVLVMTFMMLVEGPMWLERFWKLQPKEKRERRQKLAVQMYSVVTGYVNGQIIIAAIAAGFALIAMLVASSLLNVSINAVGLAGIIALTGLIPMIGNTLGAAIVVIVCVLTSLPLAIIMAVFFLLYQQIENVTIQPYIQSRKNELTPLLVFVAALLGIGLGGLLGGFVAIPLAGCIKILVNDKYQQRTQDNA